MNKGFKHFLVDLIANNPISVFNDESGSEYSIPTTGIENYLFDTSVPMETFDKFDILADDDFVLSCQYFVNGSVPSGLYTLQYAGIVLETATAPVLSRATNRTARDLISLARACSNKIIAQQKMAQKRNMIMGMMTENTYSN